MKGFIQLPILVVIVFLIGGTVYLLSHYDFQSNNGQPQQTTQASPSPVVTSPTASPAMKIDTSYNSQSNQFPSPKPSIMASPIPIPTPLVNTESSVQIESISPSKGKVGDVIVIQGKGFGKSSFYYPDPTNWKGMVSFYGPSGQNSGGAPSACTKDWDYSCWSDNQVKIKVPGVQPGFTFQIEVTSSDGEKSNRLPFEVIQ